jgi:spermidine/putrescine transport system ATP-binding protein
MTLLATHNLTKEFGSLTAVDDVSFAIDDEEFVSVLGPSGSGKSTILRMVAGFETPTEGEVRLGDENIVGVPPFERDINMVFQNLALFPHLTVAENIGYGLKQSGVSAAERRERTAEMLEMVRLSDYGDRPIDELSGGEQQRVALARAIVNEPALVLFDEPLSSLDRKLRQHMQDELQRIQAETGITFLYVTHDQEVALAVSDRLVVLNDGHIEQIGPVEELYDAPETKFVADFIGDINTVPATVVAVNGSFALDAGDGEVVLEQVDDRFDADETVDVCIRSHNVELLRNGGGDRDFTTSGIVRSQKYQGSDVVYTVETQWGRLTANIRGKEFGEGDEVTVAWDAADAHLFPREESKEPTVVGED